MIRGGDAFCLENCGAYWVTAPEDISLRSCLLRNQTVQQASALGFLCVWHKLYRDPSLLGETFGDRSSEDIIHRSINYDFLGCSLMTGSYSEDHKQTSDKVPLHGVPPWVNPPMTEG